MQQCPSCQHELTMKEQIDHPDSCPNCGIYFEKFLAKQSALKEGALSDKGRSGGIAGAKAAVRQGRSKRETEERARMDSRNSPIHVSVVDFDMPLWSLVMLLLKLSFAAIPAVIILTILIYGAAALLAVFDMIIH